MDRTLRNKIRIACLSAIILGSIPLAGAEIVRKSASAPYSDAITGLVFPPRLHTFEKVSARVNPDPRFGSVVAYENEAGTFADVFLYRLSADAGKKNHAGTASGSYQKNDTKAFDDQHPIKADQIGTADQGADAIAGTGIRCVSDHGPG